MISSMQRSDAFGFHTEDQIKAIIENTNKQIEIITQKKESAPKENKFRMFTSYKNIWTIAGYIPLIGTIAGIAMLIFIKNAKKDVPENLKPLCQDILTGLKIRSIVAVTSLGFILIIPDLIFTIGRNFSNNSVNKQKR